MLPETWVARIFTHFNTLWGARAASLWADSDPEYTKRVWAMALAGYEDRPQVIGDALRDCESLEHPPTLPKFKAICAQRATQQRYVALPVAATDPSVARERLAKLDARFAVDPMFWAKRPKSAAAVDLLVRGARQHAGLRDILDGHIKDGGANCRSDAARGAIVRLQV